MVFHAKALELFTVAYQHLESINEDEAIEVREINHNDLYLLHPLNNYELSSHFKMGFNNVKEEVY